MNHRHRRKHEVKRLQQNQINTLCYGFTLHFLTMSGVRAGKWVSPLYSSQLLFSSSRSLRDSSKMRFNYISSSSSRSPKECKHDSFLSPDTSGQVDNVLKQNKSALTVTSKGSARGLQLLKAQECCC